MIKNWLLTNLKFIVYSILYSIYYKEPPTIYINEDLPFFLAHWNSSTIVVMTSKKYLYINKISYWSTQSKFCIYELTLIMTSLLDATLCWFLYKRRTNQVKLTNNKENIFEKKNLKWYAFIQTVASQITVYIT